MASRARAARSTSFTGVLVSCSDSPSLGLQERHIQVAAVGPHRRDLEGDCGDEPERTRAVREGPHRSRPALDLTVAVIPIYPCFPDRAARSPYSSETCSRPPLVQREDRQRRE